MKSAFMTETGILTFHNNDNIGAILQAYALRVALNKLSFESEVIDFRSSSKERERKNKLFISSRPLKIKSRKDHRDIVEGFIDESLKISSESKITDNNDDAIQWIESLDYDILVTGSDEIWKIQNKKENNLLDTIFPSRPFPNPYFLHPDMSEIKIAYAASANKTDMKSLTPSQREIFKDRVQSYDHISVRDTHTEKILKRIGVEDVHRVPDPTILCNLPNPDATNVLRENGVDLGEPILGFHGKDTRVFKEICDYYKNKGYQVVAPRTSRFADFEFKGKLSPFEYFSIYNNFDMVVTSSLHSTIFSVKNRSPFVTVDTSSAYENLESKTHSLLKDFSLLNRHIDAVNGDASKFYDQVDELEQPLDEAHVENHIEELRQQGFDFLEMVKENYEEDN